MARRSTDGWVETQRYLRALASWTAVAGRAVHETTDWSGLCKPRVLLDSDGLSKLSFTYYIRRLYPFLERL